MRAAHGGAGPPGKQPENQSPLATPASAPQKRQNPPRRPPPTPAAPHNPPPRPARDRDAEGGDLPHPLAPRIHGRRVLKLEQVRDDLRNQSLDLGQGRVTHVLDLLREVLPIHAVRPCPTQRRRLFLSPGVEV